MRNTKLITISISPDLFRKVDELAKEDDRTRSGIFREAFKSYLADRERRKGENETQGENTLRA